MATAKRKINNNTAKSWVVISLLVLCAAIMVATVSYAWFLNTLKIDGVQGNTGKFKYEFMGYNGDGALLFNGNNNTLANKEYRVNSESLTFDGSKNETGEFYVLVHKLEGSVDLDVSVSFNAQLNVLQEFDDVTPTEIAQQDNDGNITDDPMGGTAVQYNGGFWYCVEQVEGKFVDFNATKGAFKQAATEETGDSYFPDIRKQVRKATLDNNDYVCVRVTFGRKQAASSADFNNKQIKIYVDLNVAQKGGLPGEGKNTQHRIRTEKELKDALLAALPGDELIIEGDITHLGDVIINHPLKLTIADGSLTVRGDFRYTYIGDKNFELDLTGGSLTIEKLPMDDVTGEDSNQNPVSVGGNFIVELPKGSLTIYGRASTSQPDLAIEGVMNVYTSYLEAENNSVLTDASVLGLYLSNTRVCDLNGAPKPIRLARTTKLTVGQHSSIGTVSAVGSLEDFNLQAVRVFVINHGTIGGIDLSAMNPYMSGYPTPRIYIHNYGIIENLANQNYHIRLPHWSRPCTMDSLSKEGSENENNTLIIRENGSHMEVQTEGNSENRFKTENVIDAGKTVLLDKVNNDPTNIVIHYLDGKDAWGETVEGPTTIEKIIDYYTSKTTNENLKITPANVTSLKIICYAASDLSLTPDDYAAIRTLMPNLTTIDLGEAYSENYTLPDYAFKGLANLSTLTLSEKDIQWGSQLFADTQIKTITLPLNLASIQDDTLLDITLLYARNKASVLASGSPSLLTYLAQLGESDSKYPSHTRPAITLIFGSDLARNTMIAAVENVYNEKYPAADGAYVFFREKTTGVPNAKELNKISRMFVGNNAQIIDNYLITLNSINNQCTIHAYMGDKFDAQAQREGAHLFDFTQFRVSERETYTVIRYDSFAFFNLKLENLPNTLEFSMDLDSIGDGAFYNTNLPQNVSLGGCTVVGHAALAKNTYIKNVAALELETAGYYAFGGISMNYANTPKLTYVHGYTFEYPRRLDIGLAQYAPDYKAKNPGYNTLTGPSSGMFDSTVVIHTEHYDYTPDSLALFGYQSSARVFAPSAYSSLLVGADKGGAGYCVSTVSGFQSLGAFDASTIGVLTFKGQDVTNDLYDPGAYLYKLNTDGSSYTLAACIAPHNTTIDCYMVDSAQQYIYTNEKGVLTIPAYTDGQGRTTTHVGSVFTYNSIHNVDKLTFADEIKNVGNNFFNSSQQYAGKKYVVSIDFNQVQTIGQTAFPYQPSLVSITGDEVVSIGSKTFMSCTQLRTIVFPNATSIGANAFEGCTALETASIPKATLGTNANTFLNCSSLRIASIGPQYKASNIFRGCAKLETVYIDLSNLSNTKREYVYLQGGEGSSTNENLNVICIGEELTWEKSKNSPYWNKDADPSNDVPKTYSQTTFDIDFSQIVFADWSIENKVASVKKASGDAKATDIPYTVASPTYMLSKDGNQLTIQMVMGLSTIKGDSYVIPKALAAVKAEDGTIEQVTTILGATVPRYQTVETTEGADMVVVAIEDNVYAGKIFVDNIDFPADLKYVGQNSFAKCRFGAVHLEGASSGLTIDNYAFSGTPMSSLTIQNVVSIGAYAFEGANCGAVNIKGPTTGFSIGENSFAGSYMSSLTIENVTHIGSKAFFEIKDLDVYGGSVPVSSVALGSKLESIGVSAFEGALISSISTAHDASTPMILTIGESAFKNVKNGTDSTVNVNFGGAAVKFGPYCFQNVQMDSIIAPYTMLVQSQAFDGASVSNLVDFSVGTPAQMVEVHGYQVIETLAFKGTSSNRLQLGTVKLGANALVKGGYRSLSGALPIKTWSDVEYTGAFTYCDIGSFQFNANAAIQPEAVSFAYCTFDEIHMGAMTVFGTGVSGMGVINYQNDLDSPYRIVDKSNAGIDNTGISKFIFKECTDFGTVYLGNVTDLMFSHHNNSGKPTIALKQVENLTTLRGYAINKLTLTNDVVFPEGLPISGNAFSNSVINGNLTFSKNSSFTSSSIVSSTVNGKLNFSEGTVVGGTEPLKDSQFYGDIYFEDGVTISANYTFERCQIYATVSLGALTFTSGTNGVNAMFGNGANVGGGNHTKGYVQHLVIRNTLTEIPTQLLAYAQFDVVELQNVTKLGTAAFAHSRIGTIIGMEHVTYFGDNAFGCTSPTGSYAANSSSYHKTTVGSGMNLANAEHIGAKAFIGMDFGEGKDIILSKVTYIGQNAFQNSTIHGDLVFGTRIDTGNGNYVYQGAVSEVSAYGFAGSTILGTIHFVNVESIGEGAFKQASLAQPLTIGNVSIADSAFYGVVLSAVTFTGSPVLLANSFKDSIITTITFEKGGVIEAEAFASDAKGETGVYDTINLGEVAYIDGSYSKVEVEGEGEQITYTGAFRNATIGTINFEDSCVVTDDYPQPIANRAFADAHIDFLNFAGAARALVGDDSENQSNDLWEEAGLYSPFYGATIARLNLDNVTSIGYGFFAHLTIGSVDPVNKPSADAPNGETPPAIELMPWSLSGTTIQNGSLEFYGAVTWHPRATAHCLTIANGSLIFNGSLIANESGHNQVYVAKDMIINGLVGSGNCLVPTAHPTITSGTGKWIRRSTIVGNLTIQNTEAVNANFTYVTLGGFVLSNVKKLNNNNALINSTIRNHVDISCLTHISGYSFASNSLPANTYLYFPNLISVGNRAFEGCSGITYVYAPLLPSLGYSSFKNIASLKSIQLDSLQTFANDEKNAAFSGCSGLETIIIGDKLTSWGTNGLSGANNSKLQVVLMVEDPNQIASTSNIGLSSSAKLLVPRNALQAYEAYFGTDASKTLWGGLTRSQIDTYQFLLEEKKQVGDSYVTVTYVAELLYDNKIEIIDISIIPEDSVVNGSFTFPNTLVSTDQTITYTVVSVAGTAMSRLPHGVISITLPDTLEFVNFSGLDTPNGLQQFVIAESNEVYKTVDGILYTKNGEMLVLYPNGKDASAFELPEGVTYIGAYAFAGNRVTSSLSLSGNLLISDGAFSDCEYLTNVSLTGNIIFIGRNTITNCNYNIGINVTGSCLVLYDAELREKITVASAG